MGKNKVRNILVFLAIIVISLLPFFYIKWNTGRKKVKAATQFQIPTQLIIKVCGNGQVEGDEACDDGPNNSDQYSLEKHCNSTCTGWAPYCGDGILQTEYGEECDDGNNTSGDGCSKDCKVEPPPTPGGGGGGGGAYIGGSNVPPKATQVILKGKAYPNAEVYILKEGELIKTIKADYLGNFTFKSEEISPGVHTFSIWSKDKSGNKSILLSSTFEVTANAITELSGLLIPPTIVADKESVRYGEDITFSGQTVPKAKVVILISSQEITQEATSSATGEWQLVFNTTPLEKDTFHQAKALFESSLAGAPLRSGYSKVINFYVGEKMPTSTCPGADLNRDGRVNLIDFSILLFHWGTTNSCADQNHNGKVDLADFSIMMYYWTG